MNIEILGISELKWTEIGKFIQMTIKPTTVGKNPLEKMEELSYSTSLKCSCCCSVPQSCQTICNPMDCSMPGFLVLHSLLEFVQTQVH